MLLRITQGLVLGPLLFLVSVNDFGKAVPNATVKFVLTIQTYSSVMKIYAIRGLVIKRTVILVYYINGS